MPFTINEDTMKSEHNIDFRGVREATEKTTKRVKFLLPSATETAPDQLSKRTSLAASAVHVSRQLTKPHAKIWNTLRTGSNHRIYSTILFIDYRSAALDRHRCEVDFSILQVHCSPHRDRSLGNTRVGHREVTE